MTKIELFDSRGKFVMPSADQIAELDDATQGRFRAVQSAAADLETATTNRKAAENAVSAAIAERDNSEADLRKLMPRVTHTQLAKDFIASERARQ